MKSRNMSWVGVFLTLALAASPALADVPEPNVGTSSAASTHCGELGPTALPAALPAIEVRLAQLRSRADGDALEISCLLGGLAHIGTTPAARLLVSAYAMPPFRAEVNRLVNLLGERALAALIESRKSPSPATRAWSSSVLETMNKKLPGDAVQSKSNQVLADVLVAYGNIHDLDAIGVILSFVNSDRVQIRDAAREALSAYGQDALPKLREAYSNLTGKNARNDWSAAQVAKELFSAYDKVRLQEVYALLDEGLALEKDGKLDDAVMAFDRILARQPMLDRRAEAVPTYVQYALTIEEKDRPRALAYLRKAARLDPENARAGQIASEVAYLEGEELLAHGVTDVALFQRAAALDAANARARTELDRIDAATASRQLRVRHWKWASGAVAAVVALLILFARRPTKRKRATS
jgi:tetratricopeptide (TPR) repeat protein